MSGDSITLVSPSREHTTLALADKVLTISTSNNTSSSCFPCFSPLSDQNGHFVVPYRQVINAIFNSSDGILEVLYLAKKQNTKKYSLFRCAGSLHEGQEKLVFQWTERLMYSAYEGAGVKRSRKLRVLVNPRGGKGKAVSIYAKKLEPIFRAAGCILDVTMTTHSGHAYEIAKDISVIDYDVLVTVSGDGLVHEAMNGFADHENPRLAFSIPVAPIPTGSGNALALNLLGLEDGFDVVAAALNTIKGMPMQVDAFSVVQGGKRYLSFMSQAMGLMADLDIGTEHLRWMGDTRFFAGLLYGIMLHKPCPVRLSYKVAESDKANMVENLKIKRASVREPISKRASGTSDELFSDELPPLKYSTDDNEGWTTLEDPIMYVYAGKGPYVGRDYMAFPVSLPDDGLIDIMALRLTKRLDIVRAIADGPSGESFWHPRLVYVKAHAYRVQPFRNHGTLSVDGEAKPFEDFQVEVHSKMASLLSLYGYYKADFPANESRAAEEC